MEENPKVGIVRIIAETVVAILTTIFVNKRKRRRKEKQKETQEE